VFGNAESYTFDYKSRFFDLLQEVLEFDPWGVRFETTRLFHLVTSEVSCTLLSANAAHKPFAIDWYASLRENPSARRHIMLMRFIIAVIPFFSINVLAGYPANECPTKLEGKWHCVVHPAQASWQGIWKDYDEEISSRRSGDEIISYTINGFERLLKEEFVPIPPARNNRLIWSRSVCTDGAFMMCMRISDATTGEFIGGVDCSSIKLDQPNQYSTIVSGGNNTYVCDRIK
jgi:hypothetical protein